jgi:hypothetical protein
VEACGHTVKRRLYAHFGGGAAGLGTVPLDSALSGSWESASVETACMGGPAPMTFACIGTAPTDWFVALGGIDGGFPVTATPALSYEPFVWVGSGTGTGPCAGAFSVTVNEEP